MKIDNKRAFFDYQILEVLPGKDLETEWIGNKEDYTKICIEIGRIVAKQYKCPVDGFGRFLNSEKLQGSSKTASMPEQSLPARGGLESYPRQLPG